MRFKERLVYELFRLQQRVGITRREAQALWVLLGLIVLGAAIQQYQRNHILFEPSVYDRTDSLFAAIQSSRDSTASHAHYSDTLRRDEDAALRAMLSSGGKININLASRADLERLPRIGPAIAQRIIAYREANGPFPTIEAIESVKGIGPKTFERIAPSITVE